MQSRWPFAFGFVFCLLTLPSWAEPLPATSPEAAGLSAERLSRIGKFLKDDAGKGKLPGSVVAVARKGKLVYFEAAGFQDKAAGKIMKKDAIFRVYSMTKPWTSVAAMILVEEGRIQLTDPVSIYLPALKGLKVAIKDANGQSVVPAAREPTIQDLLRHTSGFAYDFLTANAAVKEAYRSAGLKALGRDIRDKMTPPEFIGNIASAPLSSQPGTTWEYSLSTAVLGRVIEAVTGMPLSKFLEQRVFKPLKMPDSGFVVPASEAGRIAQPLSVNEGIEVFDPATPPANDLGGEGGVSTASDYLRFAQMLLNNGQLEGERILSRTSVALMTSDHLSQDTHSIGSSPIGPGELLLGTQGYTFGLGFMVRQGQGNAAVPGSAGEFMWGGAAGTYFWVDPKEQLAAVFMSQGPLSARVAYRRIIKQLVYAAIVD